MTLSVRPKEKNSHLSYTYFPSCYCGPDNVETHVIAYTFNQVICGDPETEDDGGLVKCNCGDGSTVEGSTFETNAQVRQLRCP